MALTDQLTAIGDAIRAKTGTEDKFTLDEMATAIEGIKGGGGGENSLAQIAAGTSDDIVCEDATYLSDRLFNGDALCPKRIILPNVTSIYSDNFFTSYGITRYLEEIELGLSVVPSYCFEDAGYLKKAVFNKAYQVNNDAFAYNEKLEQFVGENVTQVGGSAFGYTESLESVNMPLLRTVGERAFIQSGLKRAVFPNLSSVSQYAFAACLNMEYADLNGGGQFRSSAFQECVALKALVIRNTTVVTTMDWDALYDSNIEDGDGYIYVYRTMLDRYKSATNWVRYADKFRAIEDYPDICGG